MAMNITPQFFNYTTPERASLSVAWYSGGNGGSKLLLLHGFPLFSQTWEPLLAYLPEQYHSISIDLLGFGHSDNPPDANLSSAYQAEMVKAFIRHYRLEHLTLVGHSLGGETALQILQDPEISARIDRLILLNATGLWRQVPEFFTNVAVISEHNALMRFKEAGLTAYLLLEKIFLHPEEISAETVEAYAEVLRQPYARECLVAAARQLTLGNFQQFQQCLTELDKPTLIIWGADDQILDVGDAFLFQAAIRNSVLKLVPACGHAPQEEKPAECAILIDEFLNGVYHGQTPDAVNELDNQSPEAEAALSELQKTRQAENERNVSTWRGYKLQMSRLIDRWSLGTVLLIIFIKILQLCKKLGMRPEENGWRKATGIFLRNEYSKFILGSFRLKYYRFQPVPTDFQSARQQLTAALADFLRRQSSFHWAVKPGLFQLRRRKALFTDIVEAFYDSNGVLLKLEPYFDDSRDSFAMLSADQLNQTLTQLIVIYNELRHVHDRKRPQIMLRRINRWLSRNRQFKYTVRMDLKLMVERIMTATFIHCEILPNPDSAMFLRKRLATPNIKVYKHPGWGLLNLIVRFTPDFSEADLWVQFHHVPVDGMPMQEMLAELKKTWGAVGSLTYPALSSPAAKPEMIYCGNRLFRARLYVNFDRFFAVRKYLNTHFQKEMNGPATVSSMIIWGMAQHPFFRDSKVLFPVDNDAEGTHAVPRERELSLIFIRPIHFLDVARPLEGFLQFQREFNQRLWRTRMGVSESYELLELYSMIHPLFYHIARYMMPAAFHEIVGTVGLSILRDAEMFISPLSDLQVNGFMSLSNMRVPTADGGTAGAISICGSKGQIKHYISAIENLSLNYHKFLALPETPQPGEATGDKRGRL